MKDIFFLCRNFGDNPHNVKKGIKIKCKNEIKRNMYHCTIIITFFTKYINIYRRKTIAILNKCEIKSRKSIL